MAISQKEYASAQVSGSFETKEATISMSPEMFELLAAGIYEDRPLAIIRELSCNARDAMKEHATNLGVELSELPQLEVHVPNAFEPYFYVRDYGTGLTHEQVFDIYLTFGKSTKTGSNDFIGQFGIGSKSPLSYTDSFIVTSFTDGKEIQYNIYKDNGIPKITKLIERDTTEKNGLKVQVAVRNQDFWSFETRIEKFFKLFDTPVNITGKVLDTTCKVVDKNDGYIIVDNYERGVFALMGGVPYAVSEELRADIQKALPVNTILLPFGIGELNIASSRENLSYVEGDTTDLALKKRVEEIKKLYFANMQKVVDEQETIYDTFQILYNNYGMTNQSWGGYTFSYGDDVTFNGELIKDIYKRIRDLNVSYRIFSKSWGISRAQETKVHSMCDFYWHSTGNNSPEGLIIFIADRSKGSVQCARNYAYNENKRVIFNPTQDEINALVEVYGDTIETVKCSEVYDTYCQKTPKTGTTATARRKVSGVFKIHKGNHGSETTEVTEVDGSETGYYVDMYRDTLLIDGCDDINKENMNFLIDNGLLSELYLIRKSAAKKNRPDNLKLLTKDVIQKLILGCVDNRHVKAKAYIDTSWEINQIQLSTAMKPFEDKLLKDYPTLRWYFNAENINNQMAKRDTFVRCYEAAKLFDCSSKLDELNVRAKKHTERAVKRHQAESREFHEKYQWMLDFCRIPHYYTTPELIEKFQGIIQDELEKL